MLSHLVGQSNRADIRHLRQLEADLAERDDTIARQERRILELLEQRDALSTRNRAVEAACAAPASARRDADGGDQVTLQDTVKTLEGRLAREQAHSEALEEKVAILMQASSRLSQDLGVEVGWSRALEAEVVALESALDAPTVEAETPVANLACLKGINLPLRRRPSTSGSHGPGRIARLCAISPNANHAPATADAAPLRRAGGSLL